MAAGIGVVTISAVGAIFAPEALPAEAGGGEFGANLIELGGAVSTLGSGLQGYAQGGVTGAIKRAGSTLLLEQVSRRLAGGLFGGIDAGTRSGAAALLGQIPEALQGVEAACGGG